jgi:hypothetical protein
VCRCVNGKKQRVRCVCNRTWTTSLPRSKPGSYLPPRVEVPPTYCVSRRWSCRVVSCYELNVGAMPRCCHQQKEDQDPVWRGGRPAEPTPLLPPRLAPHRHRGYAPDLKSTESHTAPCNCHQQRRAARTPFVTQDEEPESGPTCAATPSPSRSPSPSKRASTVGPARPQPQPRGSFFHYFFIHLFTVSCPEPVFELGELSGSIKNLLLLVGSDELDTDLESTLPVRVVRVVRVVIAYVVAVT